MKNAQAPIHALLAERWSPRAFSSEPVTEEQLDALLQAARWAPSCFNDQPWRFVVGLKGRDDGRHERLAGLLSGGNLAWAPRAPLLLVACASTRFAHNGEPNRWAAYDTGAAVMSICVQAQALGLSVHQMGGFDADGVRDAFSLPEDLLPMAAIAVGHSSEDLSALPDWARERELAPRTRRPLADLLI